MVERLGAPQGALISETVTVNKEASVKHEDEVRRVNAKFTRCRTKWMLFKR